MSNLATITNNILADSGIDDINVVVSTGSYANPAWITSLAWTKITGAPLGDYLPLVGGTMTGNINWAQTDRGITWSFNTDGASIKFYNTGDGDTDSRLEFATVDNNNEYFRWVHIPDGGSTYESMRLVPNSSGNAQLLVSGSAGIGTNSITNGTTFGGGGQVNRLKVQSSNYTALEINGSTSGGSIQFTYGTNLPNQVSGLIGYNYSNGTVNEFSITNVLSGPMIFATTNVEAMRITSGGYIWLKGGISGMTGSQVDLQVPNGARIANQLILHNGANTALSVALSCIGASSFQVAGSATFSSSVTIQGGNSLFVNNASNTRSGYLKTSSEGTELSSFAGAGEPLILIAPDTIANIRFYTGGSTSASERMRIFSGGNVRIGPSTDGDNGARLQVSGTATIGGTSGAFIGVTINNTDSTGSSRLRVTSTGSNITDVISYSASHPSRANQAWIGGDGSSTVTVLQAGGVEFLRGTSTGAATFSSSVTVGEDINLSRASSPAIVSTTNQAIRLVTNGFTAQLRTDGVFANSQGFRTDGFIQAVNLAVGASFYNTAAPTNGAIIQGNVGIGTPSPSSRLQSNNSSTFNSSTPTGAIIASNLSANNAIVDIGVDSSVLGYIQSRNVSNTTTYNLLLNPLGGNVLIGTTTDAGFRLNVNVSSTSDGIAVRKDGSSKVVLTGDGVLLWGPSANTGLLTWDTGLARINAQSTNDLDLTTSGGGRILLKSNGNVLIGTTSDNGARLQVSGTGTFENTVRALSPSNLFKEGFIIQATTTGGGGSQPAYTYYTAAGSKRWSHFLNVGDDKFHIANASNSELFTIQQNGNVGIGTQSPDANSRLDVNGQTFVAHLAIYNNNGTPSLGTSPMLYSPASATLAISTGTVERMRIASGGSVTISNLAGSGNRIVVANAGGTLISAVIGSGLAFDGTTLTATGGGSGSISGSGTSGTVALFTGATSIGNSVITQSGGNVNINSGNVLNIYRTDNARALQLYTTNNECVVDAWAATSEPLMLRSNGSGGRIVLHTNGEERMRLTNGTTSSEITFTNPTAYSTSNTYSLTYRSTTASFGIQPIANIVFDTVGDAASQIRFVTRANAPDYNTRMTINSVGNVGIGTTTPTQGKLVVSGGVSNSISSIAASFSGGSNAVNIGDDGTNAVIGAGNSGTNLVFLRRVAGVYSPAMTIVSNGNVLVNTTSDNGSRLRVNGTIWSDSSITATSFFESSDATLKTLIQDNYQAKGIDSVVAKLYIKNGKEELGYFAQDLQDVLPSSVSKGSDGLLNLSYREVHTAKIAYLEERIKQLEKKYENN